MLITGLERQPRRRRVSLFVDGRFALALATDLAAEKGLRVGMSVLRLLSYRPRSEREMRARLRRHSVDAAVIEETVARLRQAHYLDDAAFAQFWRESRQSLSPRSRRLIRSELLSKGVDADTAGATVEGVDDDEAAYRAASKRLKALAGSDYDTFRQRLGGFLTRRGFSYDVARRTIERCWGESGGGEPP